MATKETMRPQRLCDRCRRELLVKVENPHKPTVHTVADGRVWVSCACSWRSVTFSDVADAESAHTEHVQSP